MFLCQHNQLLQQALRLYGLAASVQHTSQDERARNLDKLLRMVPANLIHMMLAEVERLGHFLLCLLQFIPLIGERSEADQRIRHVDRVLCGLGNLLSKDPGRHVQLPLPGAHFA